MKQRRSAEREWVREDPAAGRPEANGDGPAGEVPYRAIVESQPEMVCRFRLDGTILFVNGAYARARGTTAHALMQANFWDFIAPGDRPGVQAMLDRLRPEAPVVRIENRFETAEGERWTLWTNRALAFDDGGQAVEVQSSGIDITERKQAEQALKASEARLGALFDRMPLAVGVVDGRGRTLVLNPAALRLHGFGSRADMLVEPAQYVDAFALYYPDGRPMPPEEWPLARALRGDYVQDFEVCLRRPDGEERIVLYSAVPIANGGADEGHIVFVMHDLTAHRHAERILQQRERQLALVLDAAPALIAHADRARRYRFVSRSYAAAFGRTPEEVAGLSIREVVGPAAYAALEPYIDRVLAGEPVEYEMELELPGQGRRYMHARYAPEVEADGEVAGFVAVVTDMTERRRAERDRALLAAIVTSSEDAIISKDLDGRIMTWNEGAERIFGYSAAEAVGRSILMLIPPDRREEEDYILDRIRGGRRVKLYDTVRVTKDGRRIDISVAISPLRDPEGRIIGASKIARDITAAKQNERALRESERRLRELNRTLERRVAERTADLEERNKELQNFAYIASHDLREPLRKIQSFADLLQKEAVDALGEEGLLFLARMQSAAARMDGLLADLLDFSRVATDTRPLRPVHLGTLVDDVLQDYEVTIRATGAVVEVDADVTVEANAAQLRQLLTNLVGNALKYRRPEVPPRVRIHAAVLDGDAADEASPAYGRLVVEDNGIGFEEKYLERIFEPFERLHGRGTYEGTGMGLALCRRIVQRHGGTITAESTLGEGSRFIVTLPLHHRGGLPVEG